MIEVKNEFSCYEVDTNDLLAIIRVIDRTGTKWRLKGATTWDKPEWFSSRDTPTGLMETGVACEGAKCEQKT